MSVLSTPSCTIARLMGELDVATTPALRVGLLNMLLLYRSTVRSAAETLVLTLTKAPLEIIFPGRVIRAELRALVALGGPCSIAVFYQDFYGDGPWSRPRITRSLVRGLSVRPFRTETSGLPGWPRGSRWNSDCRHHHPQRQLLRDARSPPGDTSSLSSRRSVARCASEYAVGSVVVTGGEDDDFCLGDYVDEPVLIVDPA